MTCGNIPYGILADMDWKTVRSAFIRARGERTQEQIAGAGGLRQNAISKLEANANKGPSVETFAKAVRGLGLSLSEFFEHLERRPLEPIPIPEGAPDDSALQLDSEERIEARVLRRLSRAFAEGLERDAQARAKHHRLPAGARPVAAERHPGARKTRPRHVPRPKKSGPKK